MPGRSEPTPSSRTVDDRDFECEVFRPVLVRGRYVGKGGVELSKAEVAVIRANCRNTDARKTVYQWIGVVIFFAAWVAVGLSLPMPWYLGVAFALFPLWGMFVLIGLVFGAAWCVGGIAMFGSYWPGRLSNALLRLGRCASCGDRLNGCQPEHDGCTVCARCGRAWKIAPDATTPGVLLARPRLAEPTHAVSDAVGRVKSTFTSSAIDRLFSRRVREEFPSAELASVRRAVWKATGWSAWKHTIALCVFSAIMALIVSAFVRQGGVGALVAVTVASIFLGTAWGSWWRLPLRHAPAVRTALLAVGRCPFCGTRLPKPDENGLSTCVPCRGVWKVRDVDSGVD